MKRTELHGELYMDGTDVGAVAIHGWQGAWGFGDFAPNAAFEAFAPRYAQWAALMHSGEASERLTEAVSRRLRDVENSLYRVHARLYVGELRQWRDLAIINIDGPLIEWKESGTGCCDGSGGPSASSCRHTESSGVLASTAPGDVAL